MKKTIIVSIFWMIYLSACGRPYNSSYSDAVKFGSSVTGSEKFILARQVMLNKCFSCHSAWSSYNEADFVTNGLVVARVLADSNLYIRIRGNDTGIAGNMPPSENLSTEEMNTFKTWIAAL